MDLLTGAMGILGPKLLDLLQHEYNLQTGLSNEVRSLSLEIEHIDTFLRMVAEVPWDQLDEQVKVWAREVREASYDMEDAVDTYLVHVNDREPGDQNMLRRALKMIGNLFTKGKPSSHDIAVVIEGIKKKLEEIAGRRARYKIDDSLAKPVAATSSSIDPRLAGMYHKVDQLIGIDETRGQIISMLSYQRGRDVNIKKVSVVGVGGLGKTTLVKAVYEELKGDFDCGAFVPVGLNPDLKRVFKDILLDLDKEHYTRDLNITILDERHLIDEIRGFLEDKRYFIVIDDIWELQSWGIINWALDDNNRGSRIITTTRNLEVAKQVGKVFKLPPLSDDHSKKLFYTRIFGGEGNCLGFQSDEVSDKILKRCGGIPLAIITMASLLVGKPREVWSDLCKDIGFRHKDNMGVENTMRILSFSYYDLPSHLRTCLLYLSAFPEDYVIQKNPLIWKWIAEGFVHKKQGNGLFELGEQCFNHLINRSVIQAVESEYNGTVIGCHVHDMVLDLIRSLSCHENSVTILDSNAEGISSQNSKVRRLACQKSGLDPIIHQAGHMDRSVIRSYIASLCHFDQWAPLWRFKLLHVLAIENCQFKENGCHHIENLGNLLHLRYLSVRDTNISELPEQIGNLKFLQTLDFDNTKIELPASIVRLTQLMCLSCGGDFVGGGVKRVLNGIGKLTSLQQLRITFGFCFNDEYKSNVSMFVKELGFLTELRVLYITFLFLDETVYRYLMRSLRNLNKIQHLVLSGSVKLCEDACVAMWEATGSMLPQHLCHLRLAIFQFSKLPSWINRLCNLSYLSLNVFTMDEHGLKLLASLTELRYLNLHDMMATVTVGKINAGDAFFPKLRYFMMRYVMVQCQHEEDSTFSFHIWNGIDPMPFGSTRRNNCAPSVVMPNLRVLETAVFVRALKDGNSNCGNTGLECLTSLKHANAFIQCQGAHAAEVEMTEFELQYAINVHPNCPTLRMFRWFQEKMASSVQDQESKDGGLPTEVEEDHGKDKEYKEEDHEDENGEEIEEVEKGTSVRKRRRT